MADGGLAPHLGRPSVRALRQEHPRPGSLHPDARLAPGRPTGPRGPLEAGPGRRRCVHGWGERVHRQPRSGQPGTGVRRDGAPERGGRRRRLSRGTVDRARLGGLAEGPGLAARRQLRDRGLPHAGRREARRSGPDRRPVPGLSGGHAGDHAVGRGRGHGGSAVGQLRDAVRARPTARPTPPHHRRRGRRVAGRRID